MATLNRVPATLPPELANRLATLSGQPNGVAEIALSALAEKSLALLSTERIIEKLDAAGEDLEQIVLTDRGRQVIDACALSRRADQASVPPTLTDKLVDRLAALSGQPDGVAEVALSALKYGSLLSLTAHGIIEPLGASREDPEEIVITAHGREMIDFCAGHILAQRLADLDRHPVGASHTAQWPVLLCPRRRGPA